VGLFGSEQGSVEGCCGDGNEPSVVIKGRYMDLVALLNVIAAGRSEVSHISCDPECKMWIWKYEIRLYSEFLLTKYRHGWA
jgi:hypothetical protein